MIQLNTPLHILFLCTGNSARSILGEAIANRLGQGRVIAHSAGSFPKGRVHPQSLALLKGLGYPTENFRSKSWDEFAAPGAPDLQIVITVCDSAADELCPIWPGGPAKVHWGLPDPAAVEGTSDEIARAFEETYAALETRLKALMSLHPETFEREKLKRELEKLAVLSAAAEQA